VEECQQRTRKEELQKCEERFEKKTIGEVKKECVESVCEEIMEFQRTGRYDLMYMKTKERGGYQNHGILKTLASRTLGEIRVRVGHRHLLKIWENYIAELYDRPNQQENFEVVLEEVYVEEKGPYVLHSEVEKAVKEMRDKKAVGDNDDVVCFLLGNSTASEFYMPTFRNTVPSS